MQQVILFFTLVFYSHLILALEPFHNELLSQSVLVVRASDGKVMYEKDADLVLNPASVTKLITTAATLDYFGPNRKFKTKVLLNGRFAKGIVLGDLIFRGGGDPFVVTEKLWQIVQDLKAMGLREIKGDLVIDNSLFQPWAKDGVREEGANSSQHAYDAQVTAFGVNFNTVCLNVIAGAKVGELAVVSIEPYPLSVVMIDNKLVTKSSGRSVIQVERQSLAGGKLKLSLKGAVSLGASPTKIYRSVPDPEIFAGDMVKAFLQHNQVFLHGKVKFSANLVHGDDFYEKDSEELSELLRGLNFFSNNYMADVLFKRLGAEYQVMHKLPAIGSYSSGVKAVSFFLKDKVGIKEPFTLINGSGLSVNTRVSARQLCSLLRYVWRNWQIFPEFLASLPTAGATGSLKNRFLNKDVAKLRGRLRAKTGSLTSPVVVSALSGFLSDEKDDLLLFTILQNGMLAKTQPDLQSLHEAQERDLLKVISLTSN